MAGSKRGRTGSNEFTHLVALKHLAKAPGNYWYTDCLFCRAAYHNNVTSVPPERTIGRRRNYQRHLSKCRHFESAQLQPASPVPATPASAASATAPLSTPSATSPASPPSIATRTRSRYAASRSTLAGTDATRMPQARRSLALGKRFQLTPNKQGSAKKKPKKKPFSKSEVKQIECSLVEMYADNHLSDRFIEQDSVLHFLELLCPGISAILPSRRVMGSRILKEHAGRCTKQATEDLRTMQTRTGGRINLLADVWQNIYKDHRWGVILSLFEATLTYALTPAGDQHHGVAQAY
ncbi:hypothetical protein PHYPSEUDO_003982 [Phytophthora pseudosyringae]|uniref:BED-type domain-containing protein n=1 Tax=Phytophthora pseudosyringae TaxID=221518 RepID=A0A8T1VPX2_9STRA|nr:hypothetical protein PHYPSEUDO_003982 [Phytophthora pseudosyringae]